MSWLIRASLQFRVIVLMIALGLIVVGVRTMDSIPLDVFPEFAPPLVEIQTEAPGISTEDVESLISVPIENAVNGIPFVKAVRSKSVLGLSSVRLIFASGTDLLMARQLVQERITLVAAQLSSRVSRRIRGSSRFKTEAATFVRSGNTHDYDNSLCRFSVMEISTPHAGYVATGNSRRSAWGFR